MKKKDIERTEEIGGKTVITYKDGTVKRFQKAGGGSFKLEPKEPRHRRLPVKRSASGNLIQQRLRAEDAETVAINETIDEQAGIQKKKTDDAEV
jgi:hypothetical protein